MKMFANFALAAVAGWLLSACGGGATSGGGGVVSTPSPPPAYASFGALTADQQVALSGSTSERTDTPAGTGATTLVQHPFSDGIMSISYNAATNGYTVRDGTRTLAFVPADIHPEYGFNGPAFVNYATGVGTNTEDYLSLYRPTGGGGDVALTYTTLAQWIHITFTDNGTSVTTRTSAGWGVGGFATLASDMPRTGTATFNGPLRGNSLNGTAVGNVTGQSRLTADFAAGTVRADLFVSRPGLSTLMLGGTGNISSARFAGNLSGDAFAGTFDGGFFGPAAAEMGLSFSVTDSAGLRIFGVGAGRR